MEPRYELHEQSANWDTVHDRTIAAFPSDQLQKAIIMAQALANFYEISFSRYEIVDLQTGEKRPIARTRN